MKKEHIAFILESAHGHINPTLALATMLVHRGYRVTYPVKEYFSHRVLASGAEPLVYSPMENKFKLLQTIRSNWDEVVQLLDEQSALCLEEKENTLAQLQGLYQANRPDLIIYDEGAYLAGRDFASRWGIQAIRYMPQTIELTDSELNVSFPSKDTHPALVFTPRFFCRNADACSARIHFIGPLYGPRNFFTPWKVTTSSAQTILVSATTGLLPQVDFFKLAIQAFQGSTLQVILSVGDEISPEKLEPLPTNFVINRTSSQLDILEHVSLFLGQGGPGSTMESLYCGVPVISIPPTPIHRIAAVRTAELGLGVCIDKDKASPDAVRKAADTLLADTATKERVRQVKSTMRTDDGATRAINLIEGLLSYESH